MIKPNLSLAAALALMTAGVRRIALGKGRPASNVKLGGAFGTPGRGRNIWRSVRGALRRAHGKNRAARINPRLYPV